MAHIAACMIDSDGETNSLRSYIANTFSTKASTDSLVSIHSADEKRSLAWRMHNTEARKYQLFPKEKQLPPVTIAKPLDLDQAHATVVNQCSDKSDKPGLSNGLLLRIKEHNLTRRRKVSVPELGPMTTVQEVSMDSPTIPGRPALHERSISTPVNALRINMRSEPRESHESPETRSSNGTAMTPTSAKVPAKQPLSPKDLAPLTIPTHSGTFPSLARKLSLSRLRSGGNQQEPTTRPPRPDESPRTRAPYTPFTPLSSTGSTPTPKSTTTYTNSTIPTPISAPPESRHSPAPWEKPHSAVSTTASHGATDIPSVPRPDLDVQVRCSSAMAHRRGQSDSGSIMERGRPRKRADGSLIGSKHKRAESKRSLSIERRAFETLPQGFRPQDALAKLDQAETAHLQKQALGQAARFEVLRREDVDNLSKELRQLDERTEYLRHTYTSLRAGRRNLQSRVCQYLRSPRMAKFSYESMLKQEETLAELDASIDDWVTKLEHAENRRTRVRQKLLEHVAAAAAMSASAGLGGVSNETLQHAIGMRPQPSASDVATPPRSPTRGATFFDCSSPSPSSSPQRVVARVPSAIIEEDEDGKSHRSRLSSSTQTALERMESIRIYADSDVYALLEDVENEFTKLNDGINSPERLPQRQTHRYKRVLHHAQSHDVLGRNGSPGVSTASPRPPPLSPPAPSPPTKSSPTQGSNVFLTSAVFQPHQTTVNA
ncbi:hypothetical protein F5B22DRAFT_500646 [Xylaria bambusicola]|uniref:uncharacterized protein n=1 Tax=Xylaria bambusicola TaxID=326684 RepID=UPI0020077544|nr:uncharacterized protein F5B22DRAFT_500646 [Xylaria bambusicola]KAI0521753.1 hypothetical protein F5B22DRAFT_500646 [Xylaria bambusicola]